MRFSTFLIIWMLSICLAIIIVHEAKGNLLIQVDNKSGALTYYLYDHVDLDNSRYQELFDALDYAKEGDTLNLILYNNRGGAVVTMDMIEERIKRSKAFVIIRVKGYAASAAAHLSLVGDMAIIDYNSKLLWHTGSVCFGPKVCFRVTKQLGWWLPEWAWYYAETIKRERWIHDPTYWCWGPIMCMQSPFSSTYVSRRYWAVYKSGQDEWVSGKDVCERKGGFVKYRLSGARYCIFAGMKRW